MSLNLLKTNQIFSLRPLNYGFLVNFCAGQPFGILSNSPPPPQKKKPQKNPPRTNVFCLTDLPPVFMRHFSNSKAETKLIKSPQKPRTSVLFLSDMNFKELLWFPQFAVVLN